MLRINTEISDSSDSPNNKRSSETYDSRSSYLMSNTITESKFTITGKSIRTPEHIPSGVNIEANIKEAERMTAIEFYNAVRNGGKWDYKQLDKKFAEFGNFHFGIVAKAAGFSEEFSLRMAGAAQIKAGTSSPDWSNPLLSEPYGDDPDDQNWIKSGFHTYSNYIESSITKISNRLRLNTPIFDNSSSEIEVKLLKP